MAKVALGIAAVTVLPVGTWAQNNPAPQAAAQQESPYKDQGEYDLATSIGKETDPQKKLDKLKEWEQKYPESKLKAQRTLFKAQALLAIAMSAYGKTDPAVMDAGQKAAQQIVDNMDNFFAPSVKPAQATDQQWADIRHTFELQSHSVLGWVAYAKRNDPEAEAEFKKILALDPNAAQVSYWLGSAIIRQKNIARYSEALYDIARAVSVTGPEALAGPAKAQAEDFLKKAYVGYHGDDKGLDQLKAQVASAALPPADFHIKSVDEVQKEQYANEEEFKKAHPDVGLWREIRAALTAADGDAYFEKVKGSQIPPAEIGTFKAKVVTVEEKDLIVNVDNATGDATLKFDKAINQKVINVGDSLEFKGVVESFTKQPYMLVLTIDDPKE
ncbi:MAG TPA: hypothetical protein VHB50_08265, partial [Bryobacteraceae bacterium]|nr:hypothetical protein [Bryobacteraceae bacterium]